jgi:glutamyl-tRNA reductase
VSGDSGFITGTSVSHTDATLEQLEAASADGQQEAVASLLDCKGVREAFVLQTCNRVEAYAVTDERAAGRRALSGVVGDLPSHVVCEMGHEESLRHLLRVAAGLESLVLGEDQILGQVRNAYEDAREAGGIGPLLENGVTKAIRVGERARTETTINEGVVSLASAAVKLAAETRGLENATAAVVGAGEMGTLAAKRLAGCVDELVLVNRTLARAESLATAVSPADARLRTAGLDDLGAIIVGADVVISSTGSSEWLIDRNELAAAGETFLVDIARPRDIPPAADGMDHLAVYDLDSLEAVTEKTRSRREAAAERVEAIVEEEFERLLTQYKRERADEVISAMYEGAERIKAEELEETFATLDLDDQQQATVEAMADSIVSRLLAAPTNSLRDAAEEDDWSTIHTALGLFDPNLESAVPEEVPFDPEMSPEEIPDSVREQMPDAVLEQLEE